MTDNSIASPTMASLRSRSVLVTGAGGFIGSRLCERLVEEGAKVRAMVRYTSDGQAGWLDRSSIRDDIEVKRGDLADRDSVFDAVRGTELVFHLGALIAIPYSYLAPESYVRTNILGTLNVLQAVRELKIGRLVHTSTSEVYGSAQSVPMTEAHPLVGQSPYSASKFATPVVTLRPFNTYGPRQSARAVIPTVTTQLLAGRPIRLGDTRPTRDFVYVDDTVEAFLKAGTVAGIEGLTVHTGTGIETRVGDLPALIAKAARLDFTLQEDASRLRPPASEVERLCADARLAAVRLGWAPRVSIEDGLARVVAFVRENPGLYRPEEYAV
jgi:nucleoside-diphosphate-sugar epimerase